ncbi:DNA/RNA nuclease SfsA [Miniphocaeibacter halophilus]|uniref:DNA/RNA nuclease SfsA n=1 Tax=Miniphocaeibacter halophilus TaxID=2931922 RepID=A0AC61MSK3_9FIRM|nr:DNA/RNA nuclease SfsA [Miniphocaeibacter halophilus]QQK07814.1 DNA/RNA nuclease SfsA [Miniphocaeibacter halophilus]
MYNEIIEGIFIKRVNRFIAEVLIDNKIEKVHVKNTGRCRELFIEGKKCYLEKSNNSNRKTKYSLISIYKNDLLINIDSQIPNKVVYDSIVDKKILSELNPTNVVREKQYKNSRFDIKFHSESLKKDFYLEVKGVTLENKGVAMFPDAPTERGSKHILELIDARKNGYGAIIVFLIQFSNAKLFKPNSPMDPNFSNNLENASKSNVRILAYDSIVTRDNIRINKEIKVQI